MIERTLCEQQRQASEALPRQESDEREMKGLRPAGWTPEPADSPRDVRSSWSLLDEARQLIPMGTGTNTKSARLRGAEPAYLVRGQGAYVWDTDGHQYIDFRASLGPITLGHGYPAVKQAIADQLDDGILFSCPHPLEVDLALQVTEMIPGAEQVRFLKTGGEAMAAAIKLARAYTGRSMVLSCGYHGWLQVLENQRGVPAEIAALTKPYEYGDLEQVEALLREHGEEVAAVSIAGSYVAMREADAFPRQLRKLTREHGVLLIVDEIVTGFRLAWGGWSEYYGLEPDLAVYGKGIANGMPLSVYLGRRDVMEMAGAGATISSTFSGETLSLAASQAVLDTYRTEPVVQRLWERGCHFRDGVNRIFQERSIPAALTGLGPCPAFSFGVGEPKVDGVRLRDAIFAAMAQRGILLFDVPYVNFSHTRSDIQKTLDCLDNVCNTLDLAKLPEFDRPAVAGIGASARSFTSS